MTQEQVPELDTVPADDSVAIPAELVSGSPTEFLSEPQARLWALVLDARAIPCHLENDGESWSLLVPSGHLVSAVHELRLFVEENRNWPPPLPLVHPLTENTLATLSVLLLLATFHNLTRLDLPLPGGHSPDWIALGNANTALIREGQWWRLVTALTLHANVLHLFSNIAIGGIFIICLCRELGSGLAWSLILGSGVIGNLLNALFQAPDHRSVGASTAVFGTVGILAAVSMVRARSHFKKRWLLLPVAASLALLTILGTEGEHTDLGAHLFGFLSGMGLGLGAEYLVRKNGRPEPRLNALLAVASILVVIWAWWEALGRT
jgi:membrane associated rhomboid family serine protease